MKNYSTLQLKAIAEIAALEVLKAMGLTAGEMSYHAAKKAYGSWFVEAEAAGRIRPVRSNTTPTGQARKWFDVSDILEARANDMAKGEIQLDSLK